MAQDRFARGVGDLFVVPVGHVGQPQDLRQVAAHRLQAARIDRYKISAYAEIPLEIVAIQRAEHFQPGGSRPGRGHKPRDNVARTVGHAEILLHELLDRQQAGRALVAVDFGQAHLLGAVEHVVGLAGVEMHLVPQPQQELLGRRTRS